MTDSTGATVNQYNPYNGLLTKVTYPDSKSIQYSYDVNGRRNQMIDPFGGNVYYAYDALSRVADVGTARVADVGTAYNDYEAEYTYYGNGLLLQIQRKMTFQARTRTTVFSSIRSRTGKLTIP
ncbi:RHS repeat domain-containing protein [Cohnella faecalis]|uniref:RHS repeat protein n=1 Tax=Cohnella faecalis TaxID=2315694 RepID=A0A398CII4_9BACL|nr:RHS repeat domain-containing protein [Cohnella faecalis]RIE01872.1 hypothetical protein D3H35_13890 [Cohnella faecalis]